MSLWTTSLYVRVSNPYFRPPVRLRISVTVEEQTILFSESSDFVVLTMWLVSCSRPGIVQFRIDMKMIFAQSFQNKNVMAPIRMGAIYRRHSKIDIFQAAKNAHR
jgi:hypothetical protein